MVVAARVVVGADSLGGKAAVSSLVLWVAYAMCLIFVGDFVGIASTIDVVELASELGLVAGIG